MVLLPDVPLVPVPVPEVPLVPDVPDVPVPLVPDVPVPVSPVVPLVPVSPVPVPLVPVPVPLVPVPLVPVSPVPVVPPVPLVPEVVPGVVVVVVSPVPVAGVSLRLQATSIDASSAALKMIFGAVVNGFIVYSSVTTIEYRRLSIELAAGNGARSILPDMQHCPARTIREPASWLTRSRYLMREFDCEN